MGTLRAKYLPGEKVYLLDDKGERIAAQVVWSEVKWSMGHPIPQRVYCLAEQVPKGVKKEFIRDIHESRLSRIEYNGKKKPAGR